MKTYKLNACYAPSLTSFPSRSILSLASTMSLYWRHIYSLIIEVMSHIPCLYTFYRLEPLFHKYGVDIIFTGHEHSYERMWPVYNLEVTQHNYINCKAPVHIITGTAGCNDLDGMCFVPMLKPQGGPFYSVYRVACTKSYC